MKSNTNLKKEMGVVCVVLYDEIYALVVCDEFVLSFRLHVNQLIMNNLLI